MLSQPPPPLVTPSEPLVPAACAPAGLVYECSGDSVTAAPDAAEGMLAHHALSDAAACGGGAAALTVATLLEPGALLHARRPLISLMNCFWHRLSSGIAAACNLRGIAAITATCTLQRPTRTAAAQAADSRRAPWRPARALRLG